jgi:GDSL-like Lipase/Acylhydrolase family
MNTRFDRIKPALVGLLVCASLLGALEITARVLSTIRDDIRQHAPTWFVYSPDLGWTRRPGFHGPEGGFERDFDEEGDFAADSGQFAAEHKIMLLGDSNTFGVGSPTSDSAAEVLDRLLPTMATINLGVVGATSYQGRVALHKYLPTLKPSVVVASYNFNDRRYVATREEADSAKAFERAWAQATGVRGTLALLLDLSYLSRVMRYGLETAHVISAPIAHIDVGSVVPRVDEESYRHNLEAMAEEASRQHVPLVFVLLKDNPLQTELLNTGVAQLSAGDLRDAVTTLQLAVDDDNMFSDEARIYLARALESVGQGDDAARARVTTYRRSLAGGRPVRLDYEYNRIMREVGRQYGVPVVDAGKVLDAHPSTYVDFCHFDAAGQRQVALLLAAEISRLIAHTD